MIYTTYFANLKKLPKDIFPISIAGKAPDWYNGAQYRKLAPKYSFFKEWKESHNNDYYIKCFKEYEFSNICNKWKNYNQNNSHHSLTLGEHLRKAFKIAKDKDFSLNTQFASYLHDCGKPFVASFTDSKGNPSKDCHYYKHENVSAYISLFMLINNVLFRKNDILYICALINLHMKPYTWKEEKTKEKYRKLLGERMYKDLMDLHYCDVNAH